MKNEFEKLDQFMRAHKPAQIAGQNIALPQSKSWWLKIAATCAVFAVVTVGSIQWHTKTMNAEAVALVETMEWDFTADEMPADVADIVALVD